MTKKNLETKNSMDENNETKKAAEGLKAKITENLLWKLGYEGEDAKTNFIKDRNEEHPNKKISQTDHKGLLKRVMGEYIRKFGLRLKEDTSENKEINEAIVSITQPITKRLFDNLANE